jgi:hypothetical protein
MKLFFLDNNRIEMLKNKFNIIFSDILQCFLPLVLLYILDNIHAQKDTQYIEQ